MVGFEASIDSASAAKTSAKNKAQAATATTATTAAIKSQTVRTAIKLAVSGMYCKSCVTWTSKACQRVKVREPEYGLSRNISCTSLPNFPPAPLPTHPNLTLSLSPNPRAERD